MNKVPRPEYPRPRFVRDNWTNLNGEWEFVLDTGDSGVYRGLWKEGAAGFDKTITVPFVPESRLSGIEYTDFFIACWYRRSFSAQKSGGRTLLHFGAADFFCEAWINGASAGTHSGGYTPFTFDVTDLLRDGDNTLTVRCRDDGRDPLQYTGKQIYYNFYNDSCFYTRCTGIWQTVWLEYVPELYIMSAKLTPDVGNARLDVLLKLNRNVPCGTAVSAYISADGREVASVSASARGDVCAFSVAMPDARLWSADDPFLYDIALTCGDDRVKSYFGMRSVAINGKAIEINGKPVFQRLVLDQGYYPDGIITAPDMEDIKNDIILSKQAGFNGARLHMKVFEPYALYYADKLGYYVWGEFPSWGMDLGDPAALGVFLPAWLEALERDYSSPALVGWCPFNETSGQRRADLLTTAYSVTKAYDPYRPVIDTSGYVHAGKTDIYDVHDYDQNPRTFAERYAPLATGDGTVYVCDTSIEKYAGQPYFVSEMGGIFWDISEHGEKDWGYGNAPKDIEEFYARFDGLVGALLDNPGVCALCYTQLTDVYQEKNGIYAFDRRVKFDDARLREALSRRAAIEK